MGRRLNLGMSFTLFLSVETFSLGSLLERFRRIRVKSRADVSPKIWVDVLSFSRDNKSLLWRPLTQRIR